jgi:alpha-tubulin suppressor-like RCC1 family protein
VDSVRGGTSTLSANSTEMPIISSNNITFNQTGFNVGGSILGTSFTTVSIVTTDLYVAGAYAYGQLGISTGFTDVLSPRGPISGASTSGNWSQIVCGERFNIALSANTFKWFGTGQGANGQFGQGAANWSQSEYTPLSGSWSRMIVGNNRTFALSANTAIWHGAGYNPNGELGFNIAPAQNVISFRALTGDWAQFVCGSTHTMAQSTGTTKWYAAGNNSVGQFGSGGTLPVSTASFILLTGNWSQMACGSLHTMAQSAGTTKWYATGYNDQGQLGLIDNSTRLSFTALTGNWSQMVCGSYHTFALSAGTTKWYATGYNSTGQLGLGDTSSRNQFTALTGDWSQIVTLPYNAAFSDNFHTWALSANTASWYAAGANNAGQLALGDTIQRNNFTPLTGAWTQIVAGNEFTAILGTSAILTNIDRSIKPFNPQLNTPGATYTAYGWKRNALAGFDIVSYVKTLTNESFNHNLGRPPSMMLVRTLNTIGNFSVYHAFASTSNLPATVYTSLGDTAGASNPTAQYWNNTEPTASQFTLGAGWGTTTFLAYLFAEIPGFSRFGSYTGNASVDGPFVWCGFKPRFVLTKKVNGVSDWLIWDSSRGPINPISPHFSVNNNAADNSTTSPTYNGYLDFTATGFKLRLTSIPNDNGGVYMFAAFADNPFGRVPGQVLAV